MARRPQFEGDDTTPTTARELRGWYTYGLAAEIFAVSGVGSFLPLALEQLARESGVLWDDRSTPCTQAATAAATAAPSVTAAAAVARDASQRHLAVRAAPDADSDRCVLPFFGGYVNTASFAMFTFSAAVFFQALTLVSSSALADHGKNRKLLLATFGYAGAASSMLFLVVPAVPLASILVIVGVVCLGCSFVVLNSYLPLLVANHPTITGCEFSRAGPDDESDVELAEHASASADAGVFPDQRPSGSVSGLPEMQLSTDISSRGVGLGYVAAVCMQVVSILVLFVLSKTSVGQAAKSLPMRIVLLNVGVSWAAGTYLSSRWLRDRPGPPLAHLTSPRIQKGRVGTTLALVKAAWQQLWATVKMAAQLRQMVVFLVAWFLLSDAIATVSSTAILFAKNELKMSTVQIALMSITAIGSGIVGAFAWPRLAARYGWSSSGTIVVCVVCFEAIPLYGMLGYVPFVRRWGVLGLQQIWEIYPMAFLHGFVLGGLSSYCRSFYGQLIPPGHEAAFYALYAFTDKGSSVIGPAVVGAVIDATGAIRLGFAFLSVLVVAPVPFLMRLRPADGRADALALARRLKATRGADRATRRRDEDDDGNSSEEIEELLGEAHY